MLTAAGGQRTYGAASHHRFIGPQLPPKSGLVERGLTNGGSSKAEVRCGKCGLLDGGLAVCVKGRPS